jgi:Family of unknown function (DUF695)
MLHAPPLLSRKPLDGGQIFLPVRLVIPCLVGEAMPSELSPGSADTDAWSLAEARQADTLFVFRFRPNLRKLAGDTRWPKRLDVVWRFAPGGHGMPSSQAAGEMGAFEDLLVTALEQELHGVLVAVVTSAGARTWVFYVHDDLPETSRRINQIPQRDVTYPIELDRESDESWSYFLDLLRSTGHVAQPGNEANRPPLKDPQ